MPQVPTEHATKQLERFDKQVQQQQQQVQQRSQAQQQQHVASLQLKDYCQSEENQHAPSIGKRLEMAQGVCAWQRMDSSQATADDSQSICAICLEPLHSQDSQGSDTVQLGKCSHAFHQPCIAQCFQVPPAHNRKQSAKWGLPELNGHLKCPACNLVYGVRTGDAPPGHARLYFFRTALPGFEEHQLAGSVPGHFVCEFILINGTQGRQHPMPGRPYTGKTLKAYFPQTSDSRGARVVLRILEAYRRRLLFTIGQSATTGLTDVVKFASIHLKTRVTGGAALHAYPDEGYLDRVSAELDEVGVTDEDVRCPGPFYSPEEHMAREVRMDETTLDRLYLGVHGGRRPLLGRVDDSIENALRTKRVQAAAPKTTQAAIRALVERFSGAGASFMVAKLSEFSAFLNQKFEQALAKASLARPGSVSLARQLSESERADASAMQAAYANGLGIIVQGEKESSKPSCVAFVDFLCGEGGVNRGLLIVCPFSEMEGWATAFAQLAPASQVGMYHGSKEERAKILVEPSCIAITIASFETACLPELRRKTWKYLIVDGHSQALSRSLMTSLFQLKGGGCTLNLLTPSTPIDQLTADEIWNRLLLAVGWFAEQFANDLKLPFGDTGGEDIFSGRMAAILPSIQGPDSVLRMVLRRSTWSSDRRQNVMGAQRP